MRKTILFALMAAAAMTPAIASAQDRGWRGRGGDSGANSNQSRGDRGGWRGNNGGRNNGGTSPVGTLSTRTGTSRSSLTPSWCTNDAAHSSVV